MSPSDARSSAPRSAPESARPFARGLLTILTAAYFAYPFAVHWLIDNGQPRGALCLSAVALAGLCWSALRSPWRWAGMAVLAALLLASYMGRPDTLVAFMPPVVVNLALAIFFARTLLRGKEPLVSRFARIERGALPPDLQVYTRHLTLIWAVFFVLMAAVSLGLALGGEYVAWEWFTGVGNYLCALAFFAIEYIYRRIRFTRYPHVPPFRILRMIRNGMREPR
jgi:uncharacterized membrane protein